MQACAANAEGAREGVEICLTGRESSRRREVSIERFIEAGLEEAFGVSFGPESKRVPPKL